jgi:hypothetical protein
MVSRKLLLAAAASLVLAGPALAQRPTLSPETMKFVSVNDPVVAITHVKVVDGTGAPAKSGQTVVINGDKIAAVGPDASVKVPAGAKVIDGTGKTVIPGLVNMHEHLFYPMQAGKAYGYEAETFTKLYLAGGVTSMRTAGAMHFAGDLHMRDSINAGKQPGPWIDVTGPYINAPGSVPQLMTINTPEEAAKAVNFYADQGAMSFKGYTNLTRAELGAAIKAAHARGIKFTAHLCSVTAREAADLGIDNLEHGMMVATDFREGKTPDKCDGKTVPFDPAKVHGLLDYLVQKKVAYTSTLSVRDTARASPGIEVYSPDVRALFENARRSPKQSPDSPLPESTRELVSYAKYFYDKGGLLLIGTDPDGRRRRGAGLRQPPRTRDPGRRRLQVRRRPEGLDHERRDLRRSGQADRLGHGRKTGRPGADRRRSGDQRQRPEQGRDRVQAGRRLRPQEADRRGARQVGSLLIR